MTPTVLVIAGSDSGGGAGIQADIKTINSLGVFAASAVTAVTVQNTQSVSAVHPIPVDIIKAQILAVMDDIPIDVIKIGMLGTADAIKAVIEALNEAHFDGPLVLDPVMVATSGDALLDEDAADALVDLMEYATVITPNIPEAEELTGMRVHDDIVVGLMGLCDTVFLKGGHGKGDTVIDTLYMAGEDHRFESPRLDTSNTHGTGCSIASAMAAYLALGESLPTACRRAHELIHQAILDAPELGKGHGPIGHHKMERS